MIHQVKKLVLEAGKMLLQDRPLEVFEKEGHGNFVTQMDKDVQAFLISNLQKNYPQVRFFAEEKENEPMDEGSYFVIDPIDGTMNFMRDRRASAISIGFIENRQPLWGIVYDPFQNRFFHAIKGEGAYENGKAITVATTPFKNALTLFGTTPYDGALAQKTMTIACQFLLQTADIRRNGAASLDLCDVASGRGDVFFELSLSPWDFAAGALIIKEAGGIITQVDGSPITFDQSCSAVAGSPLCYSRALEIIQSHL